MNVSERLQLAWKEGKYKPHPQTERGKALLREKNLGKRLSDETKARMRAAALGRKHKAETIAKIKAANSSNGCWLSARGRSPSRAEANVAKHLEALGVAFEAQHVLPGSKKLFDFAIPERRLLIEVDGCYFHGCAKCGRPGMANNLKSDAEKNQLAKERGWTLIRIPEHAVNDGSFKELI